MKYLLDTNVCIRILKGNSDNILKIVSSVDNDEVVIPSIVRFELYYGAYKSSRKDETLTVLREFLSSFHDIPFDNIISELCGKIRVDLEKNGTPIGPYDLQIGATALAYNLILITGNTREFSRIANLVIENWE